ncbi:PAS domain S-box protein [Cellvibrio sp. KY-GH-1]|uniref:PAS domain S-box protein n=1 Tax=Cellvibrio sp. KY-GH-1 TaxID=2303332 RepID=UPI001246F549|nr:PAS domain S-box protein [Cellvibrio sp. KY-GH-1]QEY16493.1 PAS domain S-box protein [Cellvibrio sp. KY-GH-1]
MKISAQSTHLNEQYIKEINLLLYKGVPQAITMNGLLALTLAFLYWYAFFEISVFSWLFLLAISLSVRGAIYLLFQRSNSQATHRWLIWFRIGVGVTGVTWGIAPILLYQGFEVHIEDLAFYAFILGGICSGAAASLAIDRCSIVLFIGASTTPLAVSLIMNDLQNYRLMGTMILLFSVFTIASSSRMGKSLKENVELRTEQIKVQEEISTQQKVTSIIARAQETFITKEKLTDSFGAIIDDILALTQSQCGFIGEALFDNKLKPYVKIHAAANQKWDEKARTINQSRISDGIEFHDTHSIFGTTLASDIPVIVNSPSTTTNFSEVPQYFSSISSYLGIPIFYNGRPLAILLLANKETGFSEIDTSLLKPITSTIAHLTQATRIQYQKHQVEVALQNASEQTQSILQSLADAIITINSVGEISFVNLAAQKIFGYSEQELIGENVSKLLPPSLKGEHDGYLRNYLRTGQAKILGIGRELEAQRKNGEVFPIELTLAEVKQQNEPLFVGAVRDISEKKRLEKLKTEFVSTVSHELRTPLTSINAALATVESGLLGELPNMAKELIQIANKNSKRLSLLINDILDFEKLSAGKMELHMQPYNVAKLLTQSATDNAPFAKSYKVDLQLNVIDESISILVDPLRFQQIMSNLISNAVKYSPPGEAVAISASSTASQLTITISDKGPGIPEKFRARIFQSFSQADGSDSRQKGGTGMGLAVSKKLTESMNGAIGFTSSENGTRFFIEFPCIEQ